MTQRLLEDYGIETLSALDIREAAHVSFPHIQALTD
jgi:hypothetical protein